MLGKTAIPLLSRSADIFGNAQLSAHFSYYLTKSSILSHMTSPPRSPSAAAECVDPITTLVKLDHVSEFDIKAKIPRISLDAKQEEIVRRLIGSVLANDGEARKQASKYGYDYWSKRKMTLNTPYDYVPFIHVLSDGSTEVEINWTGTVPPPLFCPQSGYCWYKKGTINGRTVTIGPHGGWADYRKLANSDGCISAWLHEFDPDAILRTYIEDCDRDATRRIQQAEWDILGSPDDDTIGTTCSSARESSAQSELYAEGIQIQEIVIPADPALASRPSPEAVRLNREKELFPHECDGSKERFELKEKLELERKNLGHQKTQRKRQKTQESGSDDSHLNSESSEVDSVSAESKEDLKHKPLHRRQAPTDSNDANAALKPRKGGMIRSTRLGCLSRCISKDSHAFNWPGKEEDMLMFKEFIKASCSGGSGASATGKDLQTSYKAYQLCYPELRKIGNKQLGWCCEVEYCKTNSCNIAKYHGVSVNV